MTNLTQRVLVALVAVPLIVFLSVQGGWYFYAMVAFIATLGLHEFYTLAVKKGTQAQVLVGLVFGFCIVTVFLWVRVRPMGWLWTGSQALAFLFLVFTAIIFTIELFRNKGSALLNVATTILGVSYVSLFLGSLIGIRELLAAGPVPTTSASSTAFQAETIDHGGATIISIFVAIWMCDSLAYFAGRMFGRHKLFERVSPNKTWEGAIAGYLGADMTFIAAQQFVLPYMTVVDAFICGSIVGVFGQIGDLAESLLKRDAGVKDSSALIPGHGGVLDRFDSLIFVSPLLYLFLRLVVLG
ncbi:MAG: phosphatidate cytidylyltransferase [Ignavibacteriae bacterium]|nr:phosphatidate cytidylyltransferase [Ignavibacteriota bacterium]